MKHSHRITFFLVLLFLLSQLIGLLIVEQYITTDTGVRGWVEDPGRPVLPEQQAPWYMFIAILVGTLIFFFLMKFKLFGLWKIWFFIAVFFTLTYAWVPFLGRAGLFIAILFAYFKIWRPNIFIHNFTELFIYGGLAAVFAPILTTRTAIILLILISLYDMYAVWKSKHMIKLAEFQKESKVFAGLYVPYSLKSFMKPISKQKPKGKVKRTKTIKVQSGLLGGGDMGFPLIFAGTLLIKYGLLKTMIIPVTTAIALFLLFYYAKKDKYYPAMPFVSAGCLIGYALLLII